MNIPELTDVQWFGQTLMLHEGGPIPGNGHSERCVCEGRGYIASRGIIIDGVTHRADVGTKIIGPCGESRTWESLPGLDCAVWVRKNPLNAYGLRVAVDEESSTDTRDWIWRGMRHGDASGVLIRISPDVRETVGFAIRSVLAKAVNRCVVRGDWILPIPGIRWQVDADREVEDLLSADHVQVPGKAVPESLAERLRPWSAKPDGTDWSLVVNDLATRVAIFVQCKGGPSGIENSWEIDMEWFLAEPARAP